MDEVLMFAFVSKIVLSFQNVVFTRDDPWVGGKNLTIVCFPNFNKIYVCNIEFDLWMSKGAHDIFALVTNL